MEPMTMYYKVMELIEDCRMCDKDECTERCRLEVQGKVELLCGLVSDEEEER